MDGRSRTAGEDVTGSTAWHAWQAEQARERCRGRPTSSWHEAAAQRLAEVASTSGSILLCPLCGGQLPVGDRKPDAIAWLSCGHAFCHGCLRAYVDKLYGTSWSLPCPACGEDSPPPWGVWHLYVGHEAATPAVDEADTTDCCRTSGHRNDVPGIVAAPAGAASACGSAAVAPVPPTADADPRPFNYGMCALCAAGGWFSAAGRRCLSCETVLCDTCAFAHAVSSGLDGGANEHKLVSLCSNKATDHTMPPPEQRQQWQHRGGTASTMAVREDRARPNRVTPPPPPQLHRWDDVDYGSGAQGPADATAAQACRPGSGWSQQRPATATPTASASEDRARRRTPALDVGSSAVESLAASSCYTAMDSEEDGAAARLASAFCSATSLHSYVMTM